MKRFLNYAFAVTLSMGFASCSDDGPKTPEIWEKIESYGVFVCNQGSYYSGIPGSLSYIEYDSRNVFNKVFYEANNANIGDTFQSGLVHGDNIWFCLTDSRIIHIVNRNDFKLIASIDTQKYNAGPRHITYCKNKVYVTIFGQPGYVIEIDPATFTISREVEVGNLPEYIVLFNDMLYVSVSDGYNARPQDPDAFIAIINPSSMSISTKITGIVNPVNLATNGDRLFACAWGWYESEAPYSQKDYGIYEITGTTLTSKVCDGTAMAIGNDKLYYISNPYVYGESHLTFGVYDLNSNTDAIWINKSMAGEFPTGGMAVDPVSGDVFIAFFEAGDYGYASYNTDGFVKKFTPQGTPIGTYNVGISPNYMFFNIELVEQ